MEYSYELMKKSLSDNSFKFKKKFGQNFIIDENLIDKIVREASIDKDTLVIEIGPGYGTLTNKLALYSKYVLCYEIDESLEPILDKNLKEHTNINIKFNDFMKSDIANDIKNYQYKKLYMISNLPYYITTPIINKIINDKVSFDKIVVMVQKEVGDRFVAKPGCKDYNSLSIYLNYYFDIRKVMNVDRHVFTPPPNVDSAVIELSKKENKLEIKNEDVFFKLLRDSFKQKRKTIKNNLSGYDLSVVEEVLKKYGFSLTSRAEVIPDYVFAEIANRIG